MKPHSRDFNSILARAVLSPSQASLILISEGALPTGGSIGHIDRSNPGGERKRGCFVCCLTRISYTGSGLRAPKLTASGLAVRDACGTRHASHQWHRLCTTPAIRTSHYDARSLYDRTRFSVRDGQRTQIATPTSAHACMVFRPFDPSAEHGFSGIF
ncbi:PREDICTED: uncharacterized protein LOC105145557 [Acromyrmex echinatior]|uniref:uncharacterized protein LOC105145557 n=1 Tax=Acromyrmex echinatior TaxID=103372 RepID=UPI000580F9AD|nr:PREDICTED: uncharacterized protein LOC105145557 [Acromyrmex echinatior]